VAEAARTIAAVEPFVRGDANPPGRAAVARTV